VQRPGLAPHDQTVERQAPGPDVRDGSSTDVGVGDAKVCFTLVSGHRQLNRPCPESANSGLKHRKKTRHSITSSARASRFCWTLRPSAFAVLRLTTRSYFVGNNAGKSAGFAPLRARSDVCFAAVSGRRQFGRQRCECQFRISARAAGTSKPDLYRDQGRRKDRRCSDREVSPPDPIETWHSIPRPRCRIWPLFSAARAANLWH
jgi:hypothetical protein